MTTTLTLPTERTKPEIDPLARPMLLYGRVKAGKSTLAAELDPDHTLFLATEPGHAALNIMRHEINSWEDFLAVLAELNARKGEYPYRLGVVDTVDELARMCSEYVVRGLSGNRKGFVHVSDFDWGKGHDAVSAEFRLRLAQLSRLIPGTLFISHVKESTVKERNGAETTKLSPDVGAKGMRKWLLGFVDVVAYADVIQTKEGEQRVLRLAPTEQIEAGMRAPRGVEVPDLIRLDAQDFKAILKKVAG